jgi:uncharacterized protein YyaL (SSP411 family)
MPNRLIDETSPYLLQHAENPVEWYPWGPEAMEKAKTEDKPIFLSVGYAACHWCHVMAHESFEDPKIANLLNTSFVSIKVDREERPDIDSIYMNAVVAMTGQGGWPMTVFLTPDGEPFYGGTYFPPTRRYGLPSFEDVLQAVIRAWQSDRGAIVETGQKLANHLQETSAWDTLGTGSLRASTTHQAAQALLDTYDWKQGGWGGAPRFPQPMTLEFLMMQYTRGNEKALEAVTNNLTLMSRGGLYDVVGGGFHRYSTDDAWLVPHFEKMLYDNAQLALAYLHAYQLTGSADFRRVCTETLDFILREMAHPDGGFYSSLDADSEGVEGKYYVWTPGDIEAALPDAAGRELLAQVYPVTGAGNFEGKTILQRTESLAEIARKTGLREEDFYDRLDAIHKLLYAAREQRVRPGTDDKVLVMWNALALRALAEAARYLHRADYLEAARKNAHFLLSGMLVDGQLMRAWRNGKARNPAYLEDYAGLVIALLALFQTDPNPRWYAAAEGLLGEMQAYFSDPQGGFFDTRRDQPALITRPKDIQDNATPCGNSLAANALLRMAAYSEQADWQAQVEAMLGTLQDLMVRHPTGFGMWLQAMDFAAGPVQQVAVIGTLQAPETRALLDVLWEKYRPRMVVAAAQEGADTPQLLRERGMIQGKPTAYVCQNFTCNLPVNNPEGLQQQLE